MSQNSTGIYDELMGDVPSIADCMGESLLAGERREDMAKLIQRIEKLDTSTHRGLAESAELKIKLADMLIGATTDEVSFTSEKLAGK